MIVNGSTTNKAILTGLTPNTQYEIYVVARSANMVEGKTSNTIRIKTGTWQFFNGFQILLRRGDGQWGWLMCKGLFVFHTKLNKLWFIWWTKYSEICLNLFRINFCIQNRQIFGLCRFNLPNMSYTSTLFKVWFIQYFGYSFVRFR